ncbi:DUF1642 domain-containing protein [Streptococcus hillyeri]|uniref:DUF1642 domain-containing protein n=1 Tax=Streptococcus hillyeri TaxID=2282420 RepID=UPI0034E2E35D
MNKQEAIKLINNIDTLNINDIIAGQQVDMVIKNQVLDIINQIDGLQKVVIPKFVAEWIKQNRHKTLFSALSGADWNNSPWIDWVKEIGDTATPQEIFARAWLDGYEVEKEKLYTIPLKGLITTDGHQQYLTGKVGRYFASRRNYSLKQTFTQTEVDNNIPACYREWAEPVEDE